MTPLIAGLALSAGVARPAAIDAGRKRSAAAAVRLPFCASFCDREPRRGWYMAEMRQASPFSAVCLVLRRRRTKSGVQDEGLAMAPTHVARLGSCSRPGILPQCVENAGFAPGNRPNLQVIPLDLILTPGLGPGGLSKDAPHGVAVAARSSMLRGAALRIAPHHWVRGLASPPRQATIAPKTRRSGLIRLNSRPEQLGPQTPGRGLRGWPGRGRGEAGSGIASGRGDAHALV